MADYTCLHASDQLLCHNQADLSLKQYRPVSQPLPSTIFMSHSHLITSHSHLK